MNILVKIKKMLQKLPDAPGIYLYYSAKKELIYVGKATSLRSRVRSYFRSLPSVSPLRQGGTTNPTRPIEEMIHEVVDIKWKVTDSVLEAIILEAEYIKKFQPKYNVDGKDDKSWNYIVITKDTYPKVETMREREYGVIARSEERTTKQSARFDDSLSRGIATPRANSARNDKYIFGPYPGLNTPVAMRLLRRMFRFSNCGPARQLNLSLSSPLPRRGGDSPLASAEERAAGEVLVRPCLYRQMGLCPGVCTGEISPREYRRQVIRPLVTFLSGRKKEVIKMFETEMKRAAKDERYEDAARLRDQLKSLNRIQDIALLNKSWVEYNVIARSDERTTKQSPGRSLNIGNKVSPESRGIAASADANRPPRNDVRIEGYDISNLGASDKVGSMVVLNEDGPVKSEYRKFIIKSVPGQSDVDSLREILERRLRHTEWRYPTIFLIDGGRPQVNAVCKVLKVCKVNKARQIPVVGIAKGPERKRNDFILGTDYTDFGEDDTDAKRLREKFIIWVEKHKKLLIQARDEAHRFAISFHRARRGRKLLTP